LCISIANFDPCGQVVVIKPLSVFSATSDFGELGSTELAEVSRAVAV
jgi:hypothetical protein